MMELTELKPCPFCGKPAEHKREADHHGEFFRLGCPDKDCCAHMTYYTELQEDEPAAIAAWNRRATAELTSPEYISRLRGVMGPETGETVGYKCGNKGCWCNASPVAGEVKELAGVTLNYYDGKSLLHFEAVYPDGNQVPIFSVNKKFKAIADLIFNCVNNRAAGEVKG